MNAVTAHHASPPRADFDIEKSRMRPEEQARISQATGMVCESSKSVLDVGARDGYISQLLASPTRRVTALDLVKPSFVFDYVDTVAGDVTALHFADNFFDAVICLEVLEHIPPQLLQQACRELARVARREVIIGVPNCQDTRVGRLTCPQCGAANPPWGHVNQFDKTRLIELFKGHSIVEVAYAGTRRERTNALSAALMQWAGNPYGTYGQEEGCIRCGAAMAAPPPRSTLQRIASRAALLLQQTQTKLSRPRPCWIHVHFQKRA